MAARVRVSFGIAVVAIGAAVSVLGCDAGGLLVVETNGEQPQPKPQGVAANDMVAAGTVAKNSKYKLVYTMGQPTPQSQVTGPDKTLNGGVVGATQEP